MTPTTPRSSESAATPYRSVAAGLVRGLLDFAVSKGARREELVRRSSIDLAALRDRDNRVPFASYVALMRAGQELCGDPALALHFGETIDLPERTSVGFTGGSLSRSMADHVALENRHAPLPIEIDGCDDRIQFTEVDGRCWMIDRRPDPNEFPELTELCFARVVIAVRRWVGRAVVKEVHVTHAEPAYRTEYERIFQVPVIFDSDRNAMLLPNYFRAPAKTAFASPYVSGFLAARAERARSFRGRVEALLVPILDSGDASIDAVARKLGLSRETLSRELEGEGVTFEKVLDELRRRMALHYPSAKKTPVN